MGFFRAALIVLSRVYFVSGQNSLVSLTANATMSSSTAATSSSAPTPRELLPISFTLATLHKTAYLNKSSIKTSFVLPQISDFEIAAPMI